jgi:hypothetical protein
LLEKPRAGLAQARQGPAKPAKGKMQAKRAKLAISERKGGLGARQNLPMRAGPPFSCKRFAPFAISFPEKKACALRPCNSLALSALPLDFIQI